MKLTLQKRDKRALKILIGAVLAYVLIARVGLPAVGALRGAESTAMEKEALLKKYKQVIGRKDRYDELIKQTRAQTEQVETRMIRAANPSLAAVEFQTLVEGAARNWELALSQRTVNSNPQAKEPVRDITMTLAFTCQPQQLVNFLVELRQLPKSIRVQSMNVTPVQPVHEAPKSGPFQKDLTVNMTLAAVVSVPANEGGQ